MRTASDIIDNIRAVCQKHPVDVAYLFGSHARGSADAESDIDVGILVSPALSAEGRQTLRFDLIVALSSVLPNETIDVVMLQDVPVLLQYNVIRGGIVAFERLRETRIAFVCDVERRYEDEAPFLEREAQMTIDRILALRT